MDSRKILLAVAILCVTIVAVSTQADSCIDTSGNIVAHNAAIPNPTNCGKYQICVFGTLRPLDCPASLPQFDTCDMRCVSSTTNCYTCNSAVTTTPAGGDTTAGGETTTVGGDTTTAGGDTTTVGDDTTTAGGDTTVDSGVTTTETVPTAPIIPPTPPEIP